MVCIMVVKDSSDSLYESNTRQNLIACFGQSELEAKCYSWDATTGASFSAIELQSIVHRSVAGAGKTGLTCAHLSLT